MRDRGAALEKLFLLIGLVMVWVQPHYVVSDGQGRLHQLDLLFYEGRIAFDCHSIVGPLFSSPLWWIGQWLPPHDAWVALFNPLVFTLGMLALDRLLAPSLEAGTRRRFLLLLLFASVVPYHLRQYYPEVFSATLVACALVVLARRESWGAWACVVVAVVNSPGSLVGAALVVALHLWDTRRVRYALVLPAAAGLVMLEAWIKRGSPFVTGYENDYGYQNILPYSLTAAFGHPFFFGLLSLTLSFGKGLLFFAPGVLLAPASEARRVWRPWMLFLLGLLLTYSNWWAFHGGWWYGPRFLFFSVFPAALGLACALEDAAQRGLARNLAVLLAVTLSFWVGFCGVMFGLENLGQYGADYGRYEFVTWYVPECTPLWRPFVVTPSLEGAKAYTLPALAAVYLALYVYLAAPLLRNVARQAWEGVGPVLQKATKGWHF